MTLFLDDGDVRLYHGDALETVREMPDDSVDCVVTSPPYWGLRDYGTGEWDGGDPDCDHRHKKFEGDRAERAAKASTLGGGPRANQGNSLQAEATFRDVCGKCGARRVDRQMGLEPTPDLFVQNMVELFREIRRVLAPHGTCWVNLGDSYSGGGGYAPDAPVNVARREQGSGTDGSFRFSPRVHDRQTVKPKQDTGLKPKDLVGIPWRVAFALQADGWWLRSDIIWAKPNPMPESVTDRPTKAHEYVFLLTKQPRYWFDTEAVREQSITGDARRPYGSNGAWQMDGRDKYEAGAGTLRETDATGRNVRSVWQIATQPYPEAHFATFPEELARRCILAGCPVRVCRVCGKPSERIVDRESPPDYGDRGKAADLRETGMAQHRSGYGPPGNGLGVQPVVTLGWTECGCTPRHARRVSVESGDFRVESNWRPGVVLDPFIGSGTTAKVARDHQRHAIGIDLNQEYLELAARRLQQLSLLTGGTA